MEMNKGAVGILAVACLAVCASGTYLVSRAGAPVVASQPELAISSGESDVALTVEEAAAAPPLYVESPAPVGPRREPIVAQSPRNEPVQAEPRGGEPPQVVERPDTSFVVAGGAPSAGLPGNADQLPVPEPPAPQFEELIVSTDSVVGLQIDTTVSSEEARVEDQVMARVTRDLRVGDRVAFPAGARAYGEVTEVEEGGRLRDRARLGVRFTSIVLADGTRIPIDSETIYREGDSPGAESGAKIGGGAIGGAILGGIFGGAKGAVIGASTGAGAGTAVVLAGGRNPATLPVGTNVTVRLLSDTVVLVDR